MTDLLLIFNEYYIQKMIKKFSMAILGGNISKFPISDIKLLVRKSYIYNKVKLKLFQHFRSRIY